jgi:hypothetical protein
MSLSLTCACGAKFEVAETFAGQSVACPECQQPVRVPAATGTRLRTSGYALASVVLALVGMFTIVLPALAVILGICGVVSIARHRSRVAGTSYAVFGIVLGLVFAPLMLFAVSREEIFDQFREKINTGKADFSGPLEIVRAQEGYAITRPSSKWGISREWSGEEGVGNLMLVNLGKDAYVQVIREFVSGTATLEKCRDDYVASLRDEPKFAQINEAKMPVRVSHVSVRESKRLPAVNGAEVMEVLLDMRFAGHPMSFIVRIYKRPRNGQAYIVSAWVWQRRFAATEPELRKAIDSFRILQN